MISKFLNILFLVGFCSSIYGQNANKVSYSNDSTKVEIITNLGKIIVSLSNKTPLHRDNFLKLVNEKRYDDVIFHRVIEGFMIQAGEMNRESELTKNIEDSTEIDYKIQAELNNSLFHKRGALAAARDGNAERASSAMQFYIVQGKIFNDSLLDHAEKRINGWLAEHYLLQDPMHKAWRDSIDIAMRNEDSNAFSRLNDTIKSMAADYQFEKYVIPKKHRNVYKTLGGAPHLDQNYTVFGEVLSGMDVVDSIAAKPVGEFSRPIEEIKIISMEILNE